MVALPELPTVEKVVPHYEFPRGHAARHHVDVPGHETSRRVAGGAWSSVDMDISRPPASRKSLGFADQRKTRGESERFPTPTGVGQACRQFEAVFQKRGISGSAKNKTPR